MQFQPVNAGNPKSMKVNKNILSAESQKDWHASCNLLVQSSSITGKTAVSDTFPSPAIEFLLVTDQNAFVWTIRDLLEQINLRNLLQTVDCCPAAVDYLGNLEHYIDTPIPGLILVGPDCRQKNVFNVVEAIRSDPVLRDVPLIIFTDTNYDEQTLTEFRGRADNVITGPDRARKLLLAIEQLECLSIATIMATANDESDTYSIVVPNPLKEAARFGVHCE
jgi:CheY-like chemotaxis protein